jgi:hypothetical protein
LYTAKIRELLGRPRLHDLAVSSGFCQRTSKLSPAVFFELLFYTVSRTEDASLSFMVSVLESEFGVAIKKQSLDERFNTKSEAFVKAVLSELLSEQFAGLYSKAFLPSFSRIRIKDSTKFMTPSNMEDNYKSCGGDVHSRSKSSISIQYEYDLKSGEILEINLTSGDRNDRTDAGETVAMIAKDDLIIRDLGYFSTPVFKHFMQEGAFFLSRPDSSTNAYNKSGKPISFESIYSEMQKKKEIEKEMAVYVGKETRLPVRLIMQIVPEEVYAARIRDKTRKSKGQGRGTLKEETKARSRFNLFITNAQEDKLPAALAYPLYRLRWQIELNYKIWKSVFKVGVSVRKMKEHRYITQLYVRLLLIIINLQLTQSLQRSLPPQPASDKIKILSLNKCMKTLKALGSEIFDIIWNTAGIRNKNVRSIADKLVKNHWLESKNKKLCLPELLQLFIWLSEK